jgi:hypothetical protein
VLASLVAVICTAGVILILGLVALVRARREDIPEVVQAIGHWLRGTPPSLSGRKPQKR